MIWIIICGMIYCLSVVFAYNWIKNAYSVGGVFHCKSNNAGFIDLFFTIIPVINTLFVLFSYIKDGNGKEDSEIKLNKLFNIKK